MSVIAIGVGNHWFKLSEEPHPATMSKSSKMGSRLRLNQSVDDRVPILKTKTEGKTHKCEMHCGLGHVRCFQGQKRRVCYRATKQCGWMGLCLRILAVSHEI